VGGLNNNKEVHVFSQFILGNRRVFHSGQVHRNANGDRDFLHKSVVPTDHFQKSLPRLPVPKLEDTCRRYLAAQRPILTDEEYTKTEAIVNHFREKDGLALHDQLVAQNKKNKHTSYITGPWFDMYLKDRRAVALNHNPFIAMQDDPRPEYNDQLLRATNILLSSLRFAKTLRANILEPEVYHLDPKKSDTDSFKKFVRMLPKSLSWYGAYWYKAFPLDMSQFGNLFNSTRIPRPGKDVLWTNPSATHLVVLRKGHFYTLNCVDQSGYIRPGAELMADLKYILEDTVAPAEFPLGALTTQDRDTWTTVREKLLNAGNADQLHAIDSGYYVMALDDDSHGDGDLVPLCRSFLHGDGSNRWFDKSFELLINKNGKSCVNFEHAWGDGVAVLRYFIEVFNETTKTPLVAASTLPAKTDPTLCVKRLEFNLTDELKSDIQNARNEFQSKLSTLDLNYVQYSKYNKNDIKDLKVSPDSFMQLAIQLAYLKQYGDTVATYESCSTSAFKHGRTETVRSCTSATKHACALIESKANPLPSLQEIDQAIRECSTVHNQLTKEAAMGQGFDRHLFAMRVLAQEAGQNMPDIFADPAYTKLNHIIISTSTLGHPSVLIGGFAPVVPNGLGVGYGVSDDFLGSVTTSYIARDGRTFLQALDRSFDDLFNVLYGKEFR